MIDKRNVAYIKYIFEGYDGMAIISTEDRSASTINILYSTTQQKQLKSIVKAMINEGVIKEVLKS
ncbi:MAG TPA: DUF4911 domain-containing protein [Desulfomonilia bacterium]|jgi:hypothetical protein